MLCKYFLISNLQVVHYRPVSLICITCKLFEHLICKHILSHLEDHTILTDLQHDFRSGRSCEMQLVTICLLENWCNTWGMQFNAAKCNIIRVSRTRDTHFYNNSMTGQILNEVTNAKNLRVTFSNDLEWSKHVFNMTNKSYSKFSFLRGNMKINQPFCDLVVY